MRLEGCVFCDIVEKKYEDPKAVFWNVHAPCSFVTLEPLNPVTPGHLLILPVHHVPDAAIWPKMTGAAFEVATLVANQTGVRNFNLITSNGEKATQTVRHLHIHLVPRRGEDGLHLPWTGQMKNVDVDILDVDKKKPACNRTILGCCYPLECAQEMRCKW